MPLLCYLDVETGGFNPDRDGLLSLAWSLTHPDGHVVEFYSVINTNLEIGEEALNVNGLTMEEIRAGRLEEDVFQEFAQMLNEFHPVLVMHNAPFDYGFVAAAMKRTGLPFDVDFIDTLSLARLLDPGAPNHKLTTLVGWYDLSGLTDEIAHNAMSDVRMCRALFEQALLPMATLKEIDPVNLLATWKRRQAVYPHNRVRVVRAG